MDIKFNTEYVPYEKSVTINEYKAPTDESLKLLKEYEDKAKLNLINKIEAKDNILGSPIFYFQNDISSDLMFVGKFKLNGKEIKFNGNIDRFELEQSKFGFGSNATKKFLAEKISEVITLEILKQLDQSQININNII